MHTYPVVGKVTIPMIPFLSEDQVATMRSELVGSQMAFPPELMAIRDAEVAARIAAGARVTNGETLTLPEITELPGGGVICSYRPGSYFDFVGTHLVLDQMLPNGRTVRQEYGDLEQIATLSGYNRAQYNKMVGVSTVVVDQHNQVILQVRSQRTAIVPGLMHVSLGEGMKRTDTLDGQINPKATALRGIRQELFASDVSFKDVLQVVTDIQVLALGISRAFLQPDFTVLVRMRMTAQEILDQAGRARGRWEREKLYVSPLTEPAIGQLLRENVWSPHASFALAMALRAQ